MDWNRIADALYAGRVDDVQSLTREALTDGHGAQEVLNQGLLSGMEKVGQDFKEEILFLRTGKGPLKDLLEERGMEPDQWRPPECGGVAYLDRLGFLDSLSLCVHVVHVSQEEIQLLKRSGAGVCLCPRSNLFLGHGIPPVARLLEAEIPCGLGTDSLASNHDLNLFKEMAVLVDQCGIGPDTVLAMATLHGARNLGMAGLYGSLEKGKRWLAIRVMAMDSGTIVATGCEGALEWLT